jgi:hypothetical protein
LGYFRHPKQGITQHQRTKQVDVACFKGRGSHPIGASALLDHRDMVLVRAAEEQREAEHAFTPDSSNFDGQAIFCLEE